MVVEGKTLVCGLALKFKQHDQMEVTEGEVIIFCVFSWMVTITLEEVCFWCFYALCAFNIVANFVSISKLQLP